ncbi:UDP-glucose/GDP-mannose dehydrogenase family protein [Nocardioidaceae bacterium]|nr:UDP-glucose/GDP-mannose dehydrogenase family protein [Nocardioidaceae bacterium]
MSRATTTLRNLGASLRAAVELSTAPDRSRTLRPAAPLAVSVIGCGYLGATHAAAMAACGFDVVGVDLDRRAVATLNAGSAPFHEPDLDDLLSEHTGSGRLVFSTAIDAAGDSDVHFLAVGTPQRADGDGADLSALESVVDALVPILRRDSLLVGKSTVPVGTARRLRERARALAPDGISVDLVWNPEFLREGHGVADSLRPDRLVLGCDTPGAELTMRRVYAGALADGVPMLVTDLETAELVKTAANAFLATKISFANLMADLCDRSGGDVLDLTHAIGLDERIGPKFLGAGIGYGGGCLPKDVRALRVRGEELGADMAVLHDVDAINESARRRVVDLVAAQVADRGGLEGARVAVLGAAFKAGSDDVRCSPALDVVARLQAAGARVAVYDPMAIQRARAVLPTVRYCADARAACRRADVVVVLTEWPEFAAIDPGAGHDAHGIASVVAARRVVDARHVLDADRWAAAGWDVRTPGRRDRGPLSSGG